MISFEYNQLPARVVFGSGTLGRLAAEVDSLGCKRAFVLCGARLAKTADPLGLLGARGVGSSTEAEMHTPVEVTDSVLRQVTDAGTDCLVALGGGSVIGLGKALALRTDFPQIVVPTAALGRALPRIRHHQPKLAVADPPAATH